MKVMSKTKFILAISAVVVLTASSFTLTSDCSGFEPFTKGTQYTTTSYDATGKVVSSVDATVNEVVADGNKTTATIDAVSKDAAGVEQNKSTFEFICEGGIVRMDLSALAKQQASSMGATKDAEVSVKADMLEFPAGMTVGQALPGGTVTINVKAKGSPMAAVTHVTIKDRKCVAIESKTTPAGTWECYKITSTQEGVTKIATMEMAIPPRQTTEWFSYKVGSVRTETYANGKLEGYNELTAFKKPQ
jgi:hypothetical protein